MSAEITKVVIEVEGQKLSLSVKGAKELQRILNEMFGDKEIVYRDGYWIWPWRPYRITWGNTYTYSSTDAIMCSDGNTSPPGDTLYISA